jgi:hypothetical protein
MILRGVSRQVLAAADTNHHRRSSGCRARAVPEVAQALGITTSLACRRYRRRQPVSDGREALPLASMSSGPGRWRPS